MVARMGPDRSGSRRTAIVDAGTVVLAGVIGVMPAVGPFAVLRPYEGGTAVVMVVLAGSLWWRRRAAVTVAWLAVAASGALLLAETAVPGAVLRPGAPALTLLLAPTAPFAGYAVAVYAGTRWSAWLPVVALVVFATAPWQPSLIRARQGLILIGVPALIGLYLAARRRLVDALLARAAGAEREQDLRVAQAAAQTRAQLTAEMHDVVTHRVSLIVLEAGALGLTTAEEHTRTAAERIRAAGCEALDELRELVRVLPGPHEREETPQPLPDLRPLLTAAGAAGNTVDLVEQGTPIPVIPVVGQTAYRMVQEGLTNLRKHAAGAQAQVRVVYEAAGITLTVRNGTLTTPLDAVLAGTGSGTGLLGLRQRVELVGGTFQAGPCSDGFELHAWLPASPAVTPSRQTLR
jgi:signal transduction histidine kinase